MKEIELSIIIPVYNVQKYLHKCINSIINQSSLCNYEIILVDDGSKDKSAEICDEYSEKYEFINVVHKPNSGVSSARNVGLKNANGKYILFIDSDDMLVDNVLGKLLETIKKGDSQLIQFNYNEVSENTGTIVQRGDSNDKTLDVIGKENVLKEFLNKRITISLWNKIFSREIIKDIVFDEKINYYEDKLFIFQAIMNCEKFTQINILGYNYLKRKNSASYDMFRYSYLEILDVDEKIYKEVKAKFPSELMYVKANNLEGKLELIKMMIKSEAFQNYSMEYKKIIKEIKNYDCNTIFYLKLKKKVEYICVKHLLKIYEYIIERK